MSSDPDSTPSANRHYPRVDRALAPDLGEQHPRTVDQIHALANYNGRRQDPTYGGPPVQPVALINCAPQMHLDGASPPIASVVRIGDDLVYLASVPDARVHVPAIEHRRPDFTPVEHVQWVWGLDWTEVDVLRGYCERHHGLPLELDRRAIRTEIAASSPPRHGDHLHIQLLRVAVQSHRIN